MIFLNFRPMRRAGDDRGDDPAARRDAELQGREEDPKIRCRNCRTVVTRHSERISVGGSHLHTFANPHGYVFEIGCFGHVTNCGYAGGPSREFTWFAGFHWRIVVCAACLSHLGWVFDGGDGQRFHGLILAALT